MCQLKGLSNGTHLRSVFYVCCGFHFIFVIDCLYVFDVDKMAVAIFGFTELYIIAGAVIGIHRNLPFCLMVMLFYQIVTAVFTSVMVIVTLIQQQYTAFLIRCALLTFEIFFINISAKLYHEVKFKIGHVVSPPVITEGLNYIPQVILHQPQASCVPSTSGVVFLIQPNTVDRAQIPNHDSYLPDSIQPAFNPAFISPSNPTFRN